MILWFVAIKNWRYYILKEIWGSEWNHTLNVKQKLGIYPILFIHVYQASIQYVNEWHLGGLLVVHTPSFPPFLYFKGTFHATELFPLPPSVWLLQIGGLGLKFLSCKARKWNVTFSFEIWQKQFPNSSLLIDPFVFFTFK